jgi:membrane protease YdiL (CAAX protease family)
VATAGFEASRPYLFPEEEEAKERSAALIVESQGRTMLGMSELVVGRDDPVRRKEYQTSLQSLNTGPLPQRYRHVVLIGELGGPTEALQELDDLNQRVSRRKIHPTETQQKIRDILGRLYVDYAHGDLAAPSLSDEDRDLLKSELGWAGRLALAPDRGPNQDDLQVLAVETVTSLTTPNLASGITQLLAVHRFQDAYTLDERRADERRALLDSARSTAKIELGVILVGISLAIFGFIGLVLLVALYLTGHVQAHFRLGSASGGVYAEAFAVWMVLFLVAHFAIEFEVKYLPTYTGRWLVHLGANIAVALAAFAWPVIRGVSLRQVCQDVGLTFGKRPWMELLLGPVGNILAIPLLIAAIVVISMAMKVQTQLSELSPQDNFTLDNIPAHPITEVLARPDPWVRFHVFLLACVMAPVIEELMFRGFLFRHLRELTGDLGRVGSFFVSALTVSFVFAVIHPQGLFGIPALMALAFSFALLREWRGSLVPCMIAHGLNNAFALAMNILTMSN